MNLLSGGLQPASASSLRTYARAGEAVLYTWLQELCKSGQAMPCLSTHTQALHRPQLSLAAARIARDGTQALLSLHPACVVASNPEP